MSRNWFVTGASRGLGRAVVSAALAAGDRVAAALRRPADLADLVHEHPGRLVAVPLDVTDPDAVQAAVQAATDALGDLDVVVNNAGYADLVSIEDSTPEQFRRQIDTNLLGVVYVTKAVLPRMRERGRGHIVNVSSVGGRLGNPGLGAYQAAKWAVNGFTEVLAAEVSGLGVRVTAIEPGGMATDWSGSSMTVPTPSAPYKETVGVLADLFQEGAIRPLGDTAKVADLVVWLAGTDDPPVRLLVGSDALAAARAAARTTAARDAEWEQLTRSTDRDDATAAERDPLGNEDA
ncbi:short-chain dehydrogenase/reductase [Pseudonocardia sp. CNS-139]|nr:short-chain dehydrogenase/reductase [Pseudonocardia sp. CNS-139]